MKETQLHKSVKQIVTEENELITGVTYTCTLDNFVCPCCWPLDQMLFPTDPSVRPKIPRHEGCRCLYLPKTKTFRELGLDMDEFHNTRLWNISRMITHNKNDPSKLLKHPKREYLAHGEFCGSAEDWIRTLPIETQKDFFASEIAWSLWKSGKIKAADLIDPQTWKLRSDEDLLAISSKHGAS